MRILANPKDHPWKTESGYGILYRYMCHYLVREHEVAVHAPVGNLFSMDYVKDQIPPHTKRNPSDQEVEVEIPIYPGNGDQYSEEILSYHYDDFKADILLQSSDMFMLNPNLTIKHAREGKIRWILFSPVDYERPIIADIIDRFRAAYRIIPWCNDAYQKLVEHGLTNVLPTIYPGLNCSLWQPLDRKKFPNTMKQMGYDPDGNSFNILNVSANQWGRKNLGEMFEGIALFRKKHPEANTRFYAHTPPASRDGWDLRRLAEMFHLEDILVTLDPYQFELGKYPEETMVKVFNMADVCMSIGLEGFGYSSVQAQACGVPVIGLGAGPTPELVKYGVLLKPAFRQLAPSFLWNVYPSPVDIAEALEMLYLNRDRTNETRKEAIQWVKETFDWPVVMEQWSDVLEGIESDLYRECKLRSEFPPKPSLWCEERATRIVKRL